MTPRSDPVMARVRGLAALALTVAGLTWLVTACASSQAAAHRVPPAAVRTTCNQVSAVLSDGPDPSTDPVGYAQAQILPLGQIRTPDQALGAAISKLARAYHAFFASNGSSGAAKVAVVAASRQVNSFCPGAAS